MKKNLLLIILLFLFCSVVKAQINIGGDNKPENFSVLQLTGTDGGLRVNQLNETQVSELTSKIIESGKLVEAQGLLVYNTTEGCYNVFKGEKFKSLCATSPRAVFDPDSTLICNSLQIHGEYMEDQSLNSSHFLILNVLCTQPGPYAITCTVHNGDGTNGYAFTKSDVVLEPGRYAFTVPGSGTPIRPGFDTLHISINETQYLCLLDGIISVLPAPERAIFQITHVEQVGDHFTTSNHYRNNEEYTVKATIKVSQSGEQSELYTMINGLEFKYTPAEDSLWIGPQGYVSTVYRCDGTVIDDPSTCDPSLLTTETELVGDTAAVEYEVILQCTGNPVTYGWHEGSVQGLSGKYGVTVYSPPVRLLFLSRPIHILGASGGFYNIAHSAGSNTMPYQMLIEPGNFIYKDEANPGQYIEDFLFVETSGTPTDVQLSSADIVQLGYNVHAGNNAPLVNFVKDREGVLLYFGQDNTAEIIALIQGITGETVTIDGRGGGGSVFQFIDIAGDPIINGHFGSLVGKYWGEDAGTNHRITSPVPDRFVVYSYNETAINCIRDNRLGFIWAGDGGVVSNTPNATSSTSYPFNIDSTTKLPAAQTYYNVPEGGGVWNSLFIANAIWWAIDYLRRNGQID